MDSLRIDSGDVRLAINDDPNRVISFNPSDVGFAERFYKIVSEFEVKQLEYEQRAAKLTDEDLGARLTLLRETCDYLREKIDYVFGAETSQKAFGDALVLDQFSQFFDGISPYIKTARAQKLQQYISPTKGKTKRK